MAQVYVFGGLGADDRIFRQIDWNGQDVTHMQLIPVRPNESITSYAEKLSTQIIHPNPILIGVSFGGILAVEVAKFIAVEKLILISSVKQRSEIPFYIRVLRWIPLHRWVPVQWLRRPTFITLWFFGIHDRADGALLKTILKETNLIFLRWAIDQIVRWDNNVIPANTFSVHGSGDGILPIHFVYADIVIEGGGHFMVYTNAKELSEILKVQTQQ